MKLNNSSVWTAGLICSLSCLSWLGLASLVLPSKSVAQPSTSEPALTKQIPRFERREYNPAVLHLRFTEAAGRTSKTDADAFLDLTLILASGDVKGVRVDLSFKDFKAQLRKLYSQLSRLEPLNETDPAAPSRQLHAVLIAPLMPILLEEGVTSLLIGADRGLQAVPFSALNDGERFFGDRFAFSITPSLALTTFDASDEPSRRLLAFGASQFDGLASLPLVPQELNQIGSQGGKDQFLNQEFTPSALFEKAGSADYNQLHVATHAEFKSGGPTASQLHSGTGPISMERLTALRKSRRGVPFDLVVFSACRTALGDADAELGFSGLALQAGARSAIGTLWYVDDVVTSAYFVQMYRYLTQGVPKAEAMQLTRQAFIRGQIRLQNDQVVAAEGPPLLTDLTPTQQRRVANGVENPFFWAGIGLMGAPW